jgi:SAM-dependent methyltransferase
MNAPASSSPETRFSDRVANYVRYRPGYPEEILTLLQRDAGLSANSSVADVGSGTGISAAMLLRAGCRVIGVEPNREMREAAEKMLAAESRFRSVDATAQKTTLPDQSVDLIVAAQAFHWFDTPETRAEFSRILKPGGHVALIWNERKLEATPFLRDYEALLLRFGVDYERVRHENIDPSKLAHFFRGSFTTHIFANAQHFDYAGLEGRLLSSSYAPAAGHPDHKPMLVELRRVFDQHQQNGQIIFDYDTRVHLGR